MFCVLTLFLFQQEIHLDIGKEYTLRIEFDPAYKDDLHIRTIDEVLHIAYKEHPHIVSSITPSDFEFVLMDFIYWVCSISLSRTMWNIRNLSNKPHYSL